MEGTNKVETTRLDPIYRQCQRMVYAQALKIVRDEETAHDMVQEAFIRALRHLEKLEAKKDPGSWMRRIVTNLCFDELRKRRTRREAVMVQAEEVPAPTNAEYEPAYGFENLETRALLEESLARLSPNHLELFLMREIEGMSYAEMAERAQCPPGTVMSRLFHARKKLQSYVSRGLKYGSSKRRNRDLCGDHSGWTQEPALESGAF